MQKLRYKLLNKFIENNVTSKEIDFLFYISRFQNDAGEVMGIYYKDVCDQIGISYQTFYNILLDLQKKEIIELVRNSEVDYDIKILDNDFTDKDFSGGYYNTSNTVFTSPEFQKLKAKEKLLFLDLFKILQSNKGHWAIEKDKFYEKYQELLHVTGKVLRGYLHSIKKLLLTCRKNFKYFFTLKKDMYANNQGRKRSDESIYNENVIRSTCRRNKIREYSDQELQDTAKLITQYKEIASFSGKYILQLVIDGIRESLDIINMYKAANEKKDYMLRPRLIHKVIKRKLKLA